MTIKPYDIFKTIPGNTFFSITFFRGKKRQTVTARRDVLPKTDKTLRLSKPMGKNRSIAFMPKNKDMGIKVVPLDKIVSIKTDGIEHKFKTV